MGRRFAALSFACLLALALPACSSGGGPRTDDGDGGSDTQDAGNAGGLDAGGGGDSGPGPGTDGGDPDPDQDAGGDPGGGDAGSGSGDSAVGAACTGDGDCDGDLTCETSLADFVELPGGYCTKQCDGSGSSCPSGSSCEGFGAGGFGAQYCFKSCSGDSECRTEDGYSCDSLGFGGGGTSCVPDFGGGLPGGDGGFGFPGSDGGFGFP